MNSSILARNWLPQWSRTTIKLIQQKNTGLMIACKRGDVECALEWLQFCNPQHINAIGETALIIACQKGIVPVAEQLIDKRLAQITHRDKTGRSALDYSRLHPMMNGVSSVLLYLSRHEYDEKYESLKKLYFTRRLI